jgi:hypothetical protein
MLVAAALFNSPSFIAGKSSSVAELGAEPVVVPVVVSVVELVVKLWVQGAQHPYSSTCPEDLGLNRLSPHHRHHPYQDRTPA